MLSLWQTLTLLCLALCFALLRSALLSFALFVSLIGRSLSYHVFPTFPLPSSHYLPPISSLLFSFSSIYVHVVQHLPPSLVTSLLSPLLPSLSRQRPTLTVWEAPREVLIMTRLDVLQAPLISFSHIFSVLYSPLCFHLFPILLSSDLSSFTSKLIFPTPHFVTREAVLSLLSSLPVRTSRSKCTDCVTCVRTISYLARLANSLDVPEDCLAPVGAPPWGPNDPAAPSPLCCLPPAVPAPDPERNRFFRFP
jgi:hypothetical protein